MKKILIASGNPGKLREYEAILGHLPLKLLLPNDISLDLDVPEDGATYAENAAKKARAYAAASHLTVLADDSGLEVHALDGAPGLHSARYAPWEGAQDADRRRLLLQHLEGIPQPWTAHFHCTIAISDAQGGLYYVEGQCHGQILPEERGSNGFGYDPIFFIPELGKTMAELPSEIKNRISHRGRAAAAAEPIIKSLLDL